MIEKTLMVHAQHSYCLALALELNLEMEMNAELEAEAEPIPIAMHEWPSPRQIKSRETWIACKWKVRQSRQASILLSIITV